MLVIRPIWGQPRSLAWVTLKSSWDKTKIRNHVLTYTYCMKHFIPLNGIISNWISRLFLPPPLLNTLRLFLLVKADITWHCIAWPIFFAKDWTKKFAKGLENCKRFQYFRSLARRCEFFPSKKTVSIPLVGVDTLNDILCNRSKNNLSSA